MVVDQGSSVVAPSTGRRWFTGLLVVACAGLSLEVVLLARNNRELQARLAAAQTRPAAARVQPGDVIAPVSLLDQGGSRVEVRFGAGQPNSILLFFATGCDACERIYPVWNDLFAEAETADPRVLAIRVDEAGNAAGEGDPTLGAPVFTLPEHDASSLRDVQSVPTTLMVDEYGVVRRAWMGMLPAEAVEEIHNALANGVLP
jgi:peroxiredoxin